MSKKHTGFVINREEATARDVLRLIKTIQYKVRSQYGVLLEPEVRIFGEDTDEKRGADSIEDFSFSEERSFVLWIR